MANLTIDMITNEAVRLFTQTNAFLRRVNKQYDDQFARTGAKIGDTLRIRLPNDYTVGSGPVITPQGNDERYVPLTVGNQKHVALAFGSAEQTMDLDDYSERYLAPAVNRLAAVVAADLMSVTAQSAGLVQNAPSGTLASPTAGTWLEAGARLDMSLAPREGRMILLDPITQARTVAGLAGLFNPQRTISDQFESGLITRDTLGFDWYADQTVKTRTTGTAATASVNGAGQTGTTLTISALSGTLKAGDVITIAGVNAVNTLTGEDQGVLQQFVVTEDAGNGDTSLGIYPPITPAGPSTRYQTVTASPGNTAQISQVLGAAASYRANIALYPEAFTFATADLVMPTKGVVDAARAEYDGVSLRVIQDYDVTNDQLITRLDILYGFAAVRPEWAVQVADVL